MRLKQWNLVIATVFLVSQLVLLPLSTVQAAASMTPSADDQLLSISTDDSADETNTEDEQNPAVTEDESKDESNTGVENDPSTEQVEPNDKGNPEQPGAPESTESNDKGNSEQPEASESNELTPQTDEEGEEATEEDEERDVDAEEEEDGANSPEENKTGFHLVLDKATQGPEDEPFSEANPLNPMNEFFVHYKWSLDDGHGYDAGDTVSFQLPKQLNILANADGKLTDQFGTVFANYHVFKYLNKHLIY